MSGDLPCLEEFASDPMTHRWGDLFNPPGLTNGWGCLQADLDVMAIRHVTFPPFSQGETQTALLLINGRSPSMEGVPVTFTWTPDRIERETQFQGLRLRTTTVMGSERHALGIRLEIANVSAEPKAVALDIRAGGGVIRDTAHWKTPYSPQEGPRISVTPWEGDPPAESLPSNSIRHDFAPGAILFSSVTSKAHSLQAMFPAPHSIDSIWMRYRLSLSAGTKWSAVFINLVGDDLDRLRAACEALRANPESLLEEARRHWISQIEAAFTPGNGRFSGHLPRLATDDSDLRRIYLNLAATLLYFRRTTSDSAVGTLYTSLMPRYWITTAFLNDTALAATALGQLDPLVLRSMTEHWLTLDWHQCFGVEYLTGDPTGNWYGVNDQALCLLARSYLSATGDRGWLSKKIAGKTVLEHLTRAATFWRERNLRKTGLADYGGRNSLLECVGSYVHEVASLNAAAAWSLRFVAGLDAGHAGDYLAEASRLTASVQKLYRKGEGFFSCRLPDGTLQPTRHIWDPALVLTTIDGDLPEETKFEITEFVARELMTPTWCRALSAADDDAGFSLRPDHQWNGSYPAWPALLCRGLFRIGRVKAALGWLRGIAKTANQGPFGQAHFVEGASPLENGGARKAPTEWPFLCDWTCSSTGAFFDVFVESLFGFRDGKLGPRAPGFDPHARLENLQVEGKRVTL